VVCIRDEAESSSDNESQESAPLDGRPLQGCAAKQVPDAKDLVISLGKRRGLPSKIDSRMPSQE
jgi:hypothetical protein